MTGAVALVTGGGRGIGRSTARAVRRHGMTVVAVSRTERELAVAAGRRRRRLHRRHVETQQACESIVDETLRRHGRVDVLVNNAGVDSGAERPIWQQDPELCPAIARGQPRGRVPPDAARHRRHGRTRSGRIVMVSSTAGEVGGAADVGVLRLQARAARSDARRRRRTSLRTASRATPSVPGGCERRCPSTPPRWRRAAQGVSIDAIWRQRDADSPAGRIVTVEEVAETIAFLASAASQRHQRRGRHHQPGQPVVGAARRSRRG